MAQVDWLDAVSYQRSGSPSDDFVSMLSPSTTIGCTERQEKAVLVITTFQGGKPMNFIVLPSPWIVKITWLADKDEPKKTSVLRRLFIP